jgi:hypothetical protein
MPKGYQGQGHADPRTALLVRCEVRVALRNGVIIFGAISSPLDHRTRSFAIVPWGCREPLRFRLADV